MQNGWIFKGRRGGCSFYIYLEDEEAAGIELSAVSSWNVIQVRNEMDYAKCQDLIFS